ncbi:hypothetical protein HZA40_05470 [Candidatus Peregrinibacteria bacterium]|nr:hypothetical protein [Candidatus Peregrinibacteria bacterium]
MEKTTLRSLFLLMIITGSLFTLTACGPETGTPVVTAPAVSGAVTTTTDQTTKKDDKKVETKVDTTPNADAAPQTDTTPKSDTTTNIDTTPKADLAPVVEPKPEVKVSTKYADGTYTKTGSYTSPAGEESVTVTVTVKGDIVESVNVVSNAENPNSQKFQGLFIAGVSDIVVGKKLDNVHAGVVNGSSLTGGGFNEAVAAIEASAQK